MTKQKRTGTVLIVDDEEAIRELVKSVLAAEGHQVLAADCGTDAVSQAEEAKPDLVLMDINMPDMNGYQATRRIKEVPSLEDTPVVFLTGRSAEEDAGRSFAYGAIAYVCKPFSAKELSDLVQATLP
ncbi:MAG: response regulator [Candidatus Zixiibacteriota bacterium]|nr:MAG: response regulator [candidate division Zixibacteria bacterium]